MKYLKFIFIIICVSNLNAVVNDSVWIRCTPLPLKYLTYYIGEIDVKNERTFTRFDKSPIGADAGIYHEK